MKISVIGCGWLGFPLALELIKKGHTILGTTRSKEKQQALQKFNIQPFELTPFTDPSVKLFNADYIIVNLPPFKDQLDWFKTWNLKKDSKIIFVSATSVYQGTGVIDENHPTAGDLATTEKWFLDQFSHVTILRLGGLIGYDRHPGKVLSGRKSLQGANHPVNLIHRDDVIGFIEFIINQNITGEVFNVVSDEHTSRKVFYSEFCERKNIEKPDFDENDLSQGKLISNSKMSALYQFKFSRMIGREL